ncbi:MAG: ATP-dependent metallopeptidase FtsH/Yme1/Tma family protein [Candidatus Sungbacteria bacterium]|nr:ATP-dependent metallopeptidase FtsH/Yme1/Tma family protein [Candidatus Sungbacteria bacterium]
MILLGFLIFILLQAIANPSSPSPKMTYQQFMEQVEKKNVSSVYVKNNKNTLIVELKTPDAALPGKPAGNKVQSNTHTVFLTSPYDAAFEKTLKEKGVTKIDAEKVPDPPESAGWGGILLSWLPMILLIGVWIYFMKKMQGGAGGALSFGKSKAKLDKGNLVTFKDVAGVEEAKEELKEIIDFLKNPKKFQRFGGRIPKGVLLVGPPGTGKTLLAKAVAGEANVPFFSISGSDFVEMFVGVGASRVRDLFEQGKKHAPCIIFMDEIDAIGKHRGTGIGGGNDEREQTLNQLLVELDGFETKEGVILIAATNRPDFLDPALLRPGRFDRQVVVDRPDIKGREEILKIHSRKMTLDGSVELSVIARQTPGMVGADLANIMNEAALLAARRSSPDDEPIVTMRDIEAAVDKVQLGLERKNKLRTPHENKVISYHEAGHALIAYTLNKLEPDNSDPLHKITNISRGTAEGLTMQLPERDRSLHGRKYLLNRLAVLYGGRIAEELIFGDVTTGASNDIEVATELATKMVCRWNMGSQECGPRTFGEPKEMVFLGSQISTEKNYSEETAVFIDKDIKSILGNQKERGRRIIETNLATLKKLAKMLIEKENLGRADFQEAFSGIILEDSFKAS